MLVFRYLLLSLLALGTDSLHGHALSASFLNIEQRGADIYQYYWLPSKEVADNRVKVGFVFPEGCVDTDGSINCEKGAFNGRIELVNLPVHA
ncbi:hypothetical protein [Halioxenophilus aromaticivorans]|uniref:Uncharacterized protein n=1 Tax=Halioxenophilus aromaticivorans TaxID=1306992 RepID=A0AAV3U368_9ALTE